MYAEYKIVEALGSKAMTSKEIAEVTKTKLTTVWDTLKKLSDEGKIEKIKNPKNPRLGLYKLKKSGSKLGKSTSKLGTRKTDFHVNKLYTYLNTIILKSFTRLKVLNPSPEIILKEFNENIKTLSDKFLGDTPSDSDLRNLKKTTRLLIESFLKTHPVNHCCDPAEKFFRVLREGFAIEKVSDVVKQVVAKGFKPPSSLKTEKMLEAVRKAHEKAFHPREFHPAPDIKLRAQFLDARPFYPHVRYYRCPWAEKDLKFAQAWVEITPRQFPGWTPPPFVGFALIQGTASLKTVRPEFHKAINRARIAADEMHIRYEDYIYAAGEGFKDRPDYCKRTVAPRYIDLGGVTHTEWVQHYINTKWAGKILLTRDDIIDAQALFLLPENYIETSQGPNKGPLETYLYEFLYEKMVVAARMNPSTDLKEIATVAIQAGLLPVEWAESPVTQKDRPELAGYNFAKYQTYRLHVTTAIFQPVMK